MSRVPFTYCVVAYCPDQGAGELLNVGVVLFSPAGGEIGWQFEQRYQRLSSAFAGFNGEVYRWSITQLAAALKNFSEARGRTLVHEPAALRSAVDVLRRVMMDEGLSLKLSEPRSGVTSNPVGELALLFERMVTSRQPATRPAHAKRTNEEVWKSVYEPKLPADVRVQLTAKKFSTADTEVEFDHAFKNGAWHVVQPVSFDYQTEDTVHKRAQEWAGTTLGLQGAAGLQKIYFLLGAPQNERLMPAYEKARNLLEKAPISHKIIEEKNAAEFAEIFTDIVRHRDE